MSEVFVRVAIAAPVGAPVDFEAARKVAAAMSPRAINAHRREVAFALSASPLFIEGSRERLVEVVDRVEKAWVSGRRVSGGLEVLEVAGFTCGDELGELGTALGAFLAFGLDLAAGVRTPAEH